MPLASVNFIFDIRDFLKQAMHGQPLLTQRQSILSIERAYR